VPFANYKNFKECQRKVAKKGIKNTGAYCGAIESKIKKARAKKKRR